ncbi:c-type cytochrome [Sphingomonas sp. H39-1-10]|uniref:c-type cytochrome n=1 Tax=Sphingomonas pollutisoli TaxID=3030829 RepID=UPI0023B8B9B2|nr:c-type cytochrome [Sphingomonas pollutisoli]MDF0491349.1 c-type cytochrome [Sphingomonas pollutisoli]
MSTPVHPVDEDFEPYEPRRRIPLPVYWIAVALVIWGTLTLFQDSAAHHRGNTERASQAAAALARSDAPGAMLFAERCSTCHQGDGGGIAGAVPPLAGSPVVAADPRAIVQILLHGIEGPIAIGGKPFDGHMPAFASVLDDAQLARLASYVRGAWGNKAAPIDAAFVARQRALTAARTQPWQGGAEVAQLAPAIGAQPAMSPPVADPSTAGALMIAGNGVGGGWSCASCHGAAGEGRDSVPRLAGLPAAYIDAQLIRFASGTRSSDAMQPVARQLDAQQRGALSRYYAGLASPSGARPSLDGAIVRGATLALNGDDARNIPSCFSCHGSSGFGVAPGFPAIAAQQSAYIAGRLAALAARNGGPPGNVMSPIARRLSDGDRRAVADYLATLPPVPAGTAAAGETRR